MQNAMNVLTNTRGKTVLSIGISLAVIMTAAIWLLAPFMPPIAFAPDKGWDDYYWKLPDPTVITRLSVWGSYALHQIAIWACIWWAQKNTLRYTRGLHPVNLLALGINLFFALFHFVQTFVWYDGLAQDVHILTSQGSVILLLVLVMIMENGRRGLFFGKKVPFKQEFTGWIRTYHGYLFSFAVIYTFWYHPMESTLGHLSGFFYTFLLLLQSSLFFTRIHLNRIWTFALEVSVLAHGTIVAIN